MTGVEKNATAGAGGAETPPPSSSSSSSNASSSNASSSSSDAAAAAGGGGVPDTGSGRREKATEAEIAAALAASGAPADMKRRWEGCAVLVYSEADQAFYNPVQVANRDLTIAVLRTFAPEYVHYRKRGERRGRGLRVLEALSATGLRSVRYWKEVEGVESVVANDVLPSAVAAIRRTLLANGVDPHSQVRPTHSDAVAHMAAARGTYDVVDIDPHGTCAPSVDTP